MILYSLCIYCQEKRNMGRKRDRFWDYAEDLKGHFKCNYCKHKFSGGASRIKSHLAGVKGRDIVICDVVPEDVKKEAYEATQETNKKLKNASTSSNNKGSTIASTSISTIQKETFVTQVSHPNSTHSCSFITKPNF